MDAAETSNESMIEGLCKQAYTPVEFEERVARYAEVLQHPHTILARSCEKVDLTYLESGEIFPLLMMMQSHIEANNGIGLAANQIGVSKRIIMLRYDKECVHAINPVIHVKRGHIKRMERCLSVNATESAYAVPRAKTINVSFDAFREVENGEVKLGNVHTRMTGLAAVVFQHELDHLNGLTIAQRGTLINEPNKEPA